MYQVQYSTNKKFKKAKSIKTSKTSCVIKKLKKNKKYYIRVRSYYINNSVIRYGKWSYIKKIKIKK